MTQVIIGFIQIANVFLLLGGVFALALFIIVLLKLNKALNIWLERNSRQ